MQGQFWKRFYGAWNGAGPKGHTMPEIARGARFSKLARRRGEGLRRNPPAEAPRIALFWPAAPGARVARASWSLHKRTGLLRRFPDFRPHACFRKTGRQFTCGFTSCEFGVFRHPRFNVVNRHGFKWHLITGAYKVFKMLTRALLLTNIKPIAQNVGSQSGLSASHRLGFWFVAQLQSLTHTVNDGIKLIVIIEHVMGYKKYVVSHAL